MTTINTVLVLLLLLLINYCVPIIIFNFAEIVAAELFDRQNQAYNADPTRLRQYVNSRCRLYRLWTTRQHNVCRRGANYMLYILHEWTLRWLLLPAMPRMRSARRDWRVDAWRPETVNVARRHYIRRFVH